LNDPIAPPALVTVVSLPPYGGLYLERFEVEYMFRPMPVGPAKMYSVETHREGYTIAQIMRSERVDLATWLHRAGVWDHLPREP